MEIYGFYNGEKKSLTQLAAENGVSYDTLLARYKAGVPFGELVQKKQASAEVAKAVFIPSVDAAGNISWTNDAGLDNPPASNIRGPQGERGPQGPQGEKGEKGNPGSSGSPYNLLDNSDFANPVAQAGLNGAHGSVAYAIDRWMAHNLTVEQQADCLKATPTKTYAYIRQKVKVTPGKTYTCAAHFSSVGVGAISVYNADMSTHYANKGNIAGRGMVTFTVPTDVDTISVLLYPNKANAASGLLYWAALYEGEYTAETLPEYQPKGYAAELAECMRYYRNFTDTDMMATGLVVSSTVLRFIIPLVFPMRVAPTVIYNGMTWLRAGGTNVSNPSTSLDSTYYRGSQIELNIKQPTNSVPYYNACVAQFSNGFTLCSDL